MPLRPASMRPPLNAGENQVAVDDELVRGEASMRPPLNAGENWVKEANPSYGSVLLQ